MDNPPAVKQKNRPGPKPTTIGGRPATFWFGDLEREILQRETKRRNLSTPSEAMRKIIHEQASAQIGNNYQPDKEQP